MMDRATFIFCLACALAVILSTGVPAAADELDEHLYYRGTSGSIDTDKFWISSGTIGQFNKGDRYDLGFENGTLWIKYWFNSEQYQTPDWWFDITFIELVELIDDGDGMLGPTDVVLSTIGLDGHDYSIQSLTDVDSVDEVTAVHSSGKFQLVFRIATRPYDYLSPADLPLPHQDQMYRQMPTEVLMKASYFGYEPNTTGRSIALVTKTSTSDDFLILFQENLSYTELNITDGTESGYFRWSSRAWNMTGPLPSVGTLSSGNLSIMYPADAAVIHGWTIGVNSLAPSSGIVEEPVYITPAKAYGIGIFVSIGIIAVAIAVTIIWRRRALKMDEEVIER